MPSFQNYKDLVQWAIKKDYDVEEVELGYKVWNFIEGDEDEAKTFGSMTEVVDFIKDQG